MYFDLLALSTRICLIMEMTIMLGCPFILHESFDQGCLISYLKHTEFDKQSKLLNTLERLVYFLYLSAYTCTDIAACVTCCLCTL
jgi:hypothetical protein